MEVHYKIKTNVRFNFFLPETSSHTAGFETGRRLDASTNVSDIRRRTQFHQHDPDWPWYCKQTTVTRFETSGLTPDPQNAAHTMVCVWVREWVRESGAGDGKEGTADNSVNHLKNFDRCCSAESAQEFFFFALKCCHYFFCFSFFWSEITRISTRYYTDHRLN